MIILLINWLIDENRIFGRHIRNKILKYLRRDIRVASKNLSSDASKERTEM